MKNVRHIIFSIVSLTLIWSNGFGQIGASCPPCEEEEKELATQKQRLKRLKNDKDTAEQAVSDAKVHFKYAVEYKKETQIAKTNACLDGSLYGAITCPIAMFRDWEALENLNKARSNLNKFEEKLKAINLDIDTANNSIEHWEKEIVLCKNRGNPGTCLKCEEGTVQPVSEGTIPGNECNKCDGKGNIRPVAAGPVPDNKCLKCDGNGNKISKSEKGKKCCNDEWVEITYYVMRYIRGCTDKTNSTEEDYNPTKDYRGLYKLKKHYATDGTVIKCTGEDVWYGSKTERACKK